MNMGLVQVSQAQGRIPVTVFQLQDRVNLGNYTELEEASKEAYNNGMRDLVIDLSQTPSMTSIGIRALIVIQKMLSQDGNRHLKLAGLTPEIREILDIAGVLQHIEIFPTVEDAIQSF
jgi:anti-anti-sigma factor